MCKPLMEEISKKMGMPEKEEQVYSGPSVEEVD